MGSSDNKLLPVPGLPFQFVRNYQDVIEQLMTAPSLNKFGNPEGANFGLASTNEFDGARILIWSAEPEVLEAIFRPENPLWKALREKGFIIQIERGRFNIQWLESVDQLWLFDGRQRALNDQARESILAFINSGKGAYLVADNAPYFVEVSSLSRRLYHTQLAGNYPGEQMIAVRGHGVTNEDYQKLYAGKQVRRHWSEQTDRIEVIRRATQYADEHQLLTDVNFIYEGRTISHIEPTPTLQTVMRASDGQILAAASVDPGQRVIVDCGFTRYFCLPKQNFILGTAGTLRYAENIAAYLMGKDDKGSDWRSWRKRRLSIVRYQNANPDFILLGLRHTDPDERWAAALATVNRNLEAFGPLVELLRDDHDDIRNLAEQALARIAAASGFEPPPFAVSSAADDREAAYRKWRERRTRLDLADRFQPVPEERISALMRSTVGDERWAAVVAAQRRRLNLAKQLIERLRAYPRTPAVRSAVMAN